MHVRDWLGLRAERVPAFRSLGAFLHVALFGFGRVLCPQRDDNFTPTYSSHKVSGDTLAEVVKIIPDFDLCGLGIGRTTV